MQAMQQYVQKLVLTEKQYSDSDDDELMIHLYSSWSTIMQGQPQLTMTTNTVLTYKAARYRSAGWD